MYAFSPQLHNAILLLVLVLLCFVLFYFSFIYDDSYWEYVVASARSAIRTVLRCAKMADSKLIAVVVVATVVADDGGGIVLYTHLHK